MLKNLSLVRIQNKNLLLEKFSVKFTIVFILTTFFFYFLT